VATLVAEIFLEVVYVPTKEEATLLIISIIDDTEFLSTANTTEADHRAVQRLNEIA
jgi:nanoRNase/pAp phosphatase (c-di-AMP/oligoRNAs hydrolase)